MEIKGNQIVCTFNYGDKDEYRRAASVSSYIGSYPDTIKRYGIDFDMSRRIVIYTVIADESKLDQAIRDLMVLSEH